MKLVIVDDHLMLRDLLCETCTRLFGHKVAATAGDGREAIEAILRTKPDLVVLDLHLPDMSGFKVVEATRKAGSKSRVLLLSGYCDDHTVYQAEQAGVQGFVDKPASHFGEMGEAFAALAAGRTYFSETFRSVQRARRNDPRSFDKLLSDAEQKILGLIGELLADEQIAHRLGISELTVEKHRSNIRRKLGLNSKAALMRYARDHGFMSDARPGAKPGGRTEPGPGSSRRGQAAGG